MRVLIIGSGGREHALAWKIAQSPLLTHLYCAPGNPGIGEIATNVPIGVEATDQILAFCLESEIDLVVVGPEVPLCLGLVDTLLEKGIKAFGPHQQAAELEGSKAFAKQFMLRHNIPTATYGEFTQVDEAIAALPSFGLPVVIKADGLAAGKGVVIAQTATEAVEALKEMMLNQRFGSAGQKVVIEAFLDGIEASQLCFLDGERIIPLQSAQDYKRAFDGDFGPNTGGMGTYSPSRLYTPKLQEKIEQKILVPFLKGLKADGIAYSGLIFIGLMICNDEPFVIEFNVRFGDPETQSLMMRLESDLLKHLVDAVAGSLYEDHLKWRDDHAVCVVIASKGYPDQYQKSIPIRGLEAVCKRDQVVVFHAGTSLENNQLVSSGGRVLNVVAKGATMQAARQKVYEAIGNIDFAGGFYRNDIGQ